MQKITIIGANSYICQGLQKRLEEYNICTLHSYDWQKHIKEITDSDWVLNFAISPDFSVRPMQSDEIIDLQIAKLIKGTKTKLVFMSSRKVYGTSDELKTHHESDTLCGFDNYSKNKIKTEQELQNILGNNLVILRIANIIGEPINRFGYNTFIGWMCESFINNDIVKISQSAQSKKDFITKTFLHQTILNILKSNKTGIFNVSSGFGTTVYDIVSGYCGKNNVIDLNPNTPVKDQFILDNAKITAINKFQFTPEHLNTYLQSCNQTLNNMKAIIRTNPMLSKGK